jgi:hypothetical protein
MMSVLATRDAQEDDVDGLLRPQLDALDLGFGQVVREVDRRRAAWKMARLDRRALSLTVNASAGCFAV